MVAEGRGQQQQLRAGADGGGVRLYHRNLGAALPRNMLRYITTPAAKGGPGLSQAEARLPTALQQACQKTTAHGISKDKGGRFTAFASGATAMAACGSTIYLGSCGLEEPGQQAAIQLADAANLALWLVQGMAAASFLACCLLPLCALQCWLRADACRGRCSCRRANLRP